MQTSAKEARSLLERVLREPFEFFKAGGKNPDRLGELYKEGLKAVREALEG